MDRSKRNAKFYNEGKMLNIDENRDNSERKYSVPESTKLSNNNDYPNVEFARDNPTCEEEFERARRERNKTKNLK
ncbi:MAG TPA: hypothetical protein GX692_08995 [Acholeplasmataceae bacterium]|jgi:hypothetical protein|nr:hypothetical protein [Acholeplasmataceae bacterium]